MANYARELFLFVLFLDKNVISDDGLEGNQTLWLGGHDQPQTLFSIRS